MNANRTSAQRLLAQAGGVSGLVYSSLPVVTFVVASSAAGLLPAIGFALSMAGLILLWRLLRRESARPVVAGFCGVAVCALIAYLVGQSRVLPAGHLDVVAVGGGLHTVDPDPAADSRLLVELAQRARSRLARRVPRCLCV